MKKVIQKLGTAQQKVNALSILGRWRILIHGIQRKERVRLRWIKLVKAIPKVYPGYLNPKPALLTISTKQIVSKLTTVNDKKRHLEIMGRWNKLARGVLAAHRYDAEDVVQSRWKRLLKRASNQGYIRLRWNMSEVN